MPFPGGFFQRRQCESVSIDGFDLHAVGQQMQGMASSACRDIQDPAFGEAPKLLRQKRRGARSCLLRGASPVHTNTD